MWWVLGIPIALVAGAGAAAVAKRRQAESQSSEVTVLPGGAIGPVVTPGATTSTGKPTVGQQASQGQLGQPDLMNLLTVALASSNPQRMREAANQIRAQYPLQAQTLDAAALAVEQTLAQQGATTAPTTTAPTTTAPTTTAPTTTAPTTTALDANAMTPQQMVTLSGAALASRNPQTMREAAARIRAAGNEQGAIALEQAANLAAAAAQATAAPTGTPTATTPAAQQTSSPQTTTTSPVPAQQTATPQQVAASMGLPWTPDVQAAVDAIRAQMQAQGLQPTIQQILTAVAKARAAGGTIPPAATTTTAPTTSASGTNKELAGQITIKLKTAKKGTASEPRDLIKQFQLQERLPRDDGSYGSETAIAIADRYGIVPAKPLYWGKKGGTYQTLVDDKNKYKAHLLNKAAQDPARADEWRAASAV